MDLNETLKKLDVNIEILVGAALPGGSRKRLLRLKAPTLERFLEEFGHTNVSIMVEGNSPLGREYKISNFVTTIEQIVMVYREREWNEVDLLGNRVDIVKALMAATCKSATTILVEIESLDHPLDQLARAAE